MPEFRPLAVRYYPFWSYQASIPETGELAQVSPTSSPDCPFVYVVNYLEYSSNQYDYVSLKGQNFSSVQDVEENYDFLDGVTYEIITESDGSYTVKYNYGKYFIYIREEGRCYMAGFIYDTYNNPDNNNAEESV